MYIYELYVYLKPAPRILYTISGTRMSKHREIAKIKFNCVNMCVCINLRSYWLEPLKVAKWTHNNGQCKLTNTKAIVTQNTRVK